MRIRKKEIRRTNKRQEERWKAAHKGVATTAASTATARSTASGRPTAGTRPAARPARRAATPEA